MRTSMDTDTDIGADINKCMDVGKFTDVDRNIAKDLEMPIRHR